MQKLQKELRTEHEGTNLWWGTAVITEVCYMQARVWHGYGYGSDAMQRMTVLEYSFR